MWFRDVPPRDWLLLAVIAVCGPYVYGTVFGYWVLATGYVLDWSDIGPGFPVIAMVYAADAVGAVLAALLLVVPIAWLARRPLPLSAAVAVLVPLVFGVGMWFELDTSGVHILRMIGIDMVAFAITCVAIGYLASRRRLRVE